MRKRLLSLFIGSLILLTVLSMQATSDSSPKVKQELFIEVGYDSNATKSYAEHVSDWFTRFAYGLALCPKVIESMNLNLGYGIGVKKFLSQIERDTIAHRGFFHFQYSFERAYTGIDSEIRYRSIRNGLRNYIWMETGSFLGLSFGKQVGIRIDAELAKLDFEGSEYFDYWAQAYEITLGYKPRPVLFEVSARVEERNHWRPAYDAMFFNGEMFLMVADDARRDVRTSIITRLGWRDGFVFNAFYQLMKNESNSYGRTFFENTVGFESGIPLFWEINVHAKTLLKLREYVEKAPLPQSSMLEEEEEGLSELEFSLIRPITDDIHLAIAYQRFWQAYKYYELKFYKNLVLTGIAFKF